MKIRIEQEITSRIENQDDSIKKILLLKKGKEFENYRDPIKGKYLSLISDSPSKNRLDPEYIKFSNEFDFDTFVEIKTEKNISNFYNFYISYARIYMDNCKDIELIQTIEKYFFKISFECLSNKLDVYWNFIFDPILLYERVTKYEIDAYKEIFKKLDVYTAREKIVELLEKVRDYNNSGLHGKDIYKDSNFENFLVDYYNLLEKKITIQNSIEKTSSDEADLNKNKVIHKGNNDIKSFRLANEIINIPKLNTLRKNLVDKNLISDISITDFKQIFLDKEITKPINFIGKGALINLAYFIYLLRFKYKILITKNEVNIQISYCFTINGNCINIDSLEQANINAKEKDTDKSPKNPTNKIVSLAQIIQSANFKTN
ncbi:MAG: hypothetical protein AB9846_17695 [Tenuifilaceae bacterium]